MNKSPAFQWYPKDILSSARVQEMTLAEEGAYRRLLDFCWLNGSVPSDEKRAARLIGKGATPEIAKVALAMFIAHPTEPDKMIHDRLDIERIKQLNNSEARRLASEARWNKQGKPTIDCGKQAESKSDAIALQTESIASSSSTTTTKKKKKDIHSSPLVLEIFDFWKTTLNHPRSVLDSKRKKLIEDRLEHFSADDLKTAISGCLASDWHMGRDPNNSTVFDGLDLIFRDAGKVEKFIGYANQPLNQNGSSKNGKVYESAGERNSRYIRETLDQCFPDFTADNHAGSAFDPEGAIFVQPTGD